VTCQTDKCNENRSSHSRSNDNDNNKDKDKDWHKDYIIRSQRKYHKYVYEGAASICFNAWQ